MAYLDVFGVPHAYELTPPAASGQVLVFIHGWLLSRVYWQAVTHQLVASHQCLTYDLRGFGESALAIDQRQAVVPTTPDGQTLSSTPYSLAAYATDLNQLLTTLGIETAWLVGHSLGGSIALWAAYLFPQQVKGVICVNAGGGIYLKADFDRFRQAGQQIVQFRPSWLRHLPLVDWAFARLMVYRPLPREWGQHRLSDLLRADANAARSALLDTTTEDEVHWLPQIVAQLRQPVYFLAGDHDQVMEPRYVHHLASFHSLFTCDGSYPRNKCNVMMLNDCGHMGMVEQPEQVAQYIQQLVQNDPQGSVGVD